MHLLLFAFAAAPCSAAYSCPMAQEGSDDDYDPGAEQQETQAEDEETEAEDDPSHVEVDEELVFAALNIPHQPQQQPVGSKRKRRTVIISRTSALKRPRQCIGGVARIGAVGQRSLGKYGAGMETSCEDCGGGPHQTTVQATDANIAPFYDKCIQGQNQKQKLDEWLGERGRHVSREEGEGATCPCACGVPAPEGYGLLCLCLRDGSAPA